MHPLFELAAIQSSRRRLDCQGFQLFQFGQRFAEDGPFRAREKIDKFLQQCCSRVVKHVTAQRTAEIFVSDSSGASFRLDHDKEDVAQEDRIRDQLFEQPTFDRLEQIDVE